MAVSNQEDISKEKEAQANDIQVVNAKDVDKQEGFIEENYDHLKRRLGNRQIQLMA